MHVAAYAAAAALVLSTAAAIVRVEVDTRADGITIRFGGSQQQRPGTLSSLPAASQPQRGHTTTSPASASVGPVITRQDLALLEERLRKELAVAKVPVPSGASSAEVLDSVRRLVEDSERRQQQELALRIAQVVKEFDAQRRADLARIDLGLGLLEQRTGAEVAQTSELLKSYVHAVSNRPRE
jgi:hypothetical protein